MQVIQIPISSHPFLEELDRELKNFVTSDERVEEAGNWSLDHIATDKIPLTDLDLPISYKRASLHHLCAKLQPRAKIYGVMLRAALFYPAGGGLGWHTNSVMPGLRAYITRSEGEESGLQLPGGFLPDRKGLVNVFRITSNWSDCWHAVRASSPRLSVGICFPPSFSDFDRLSAQAPSL